MKKSLLFVLPLLALSLVGCGEKTTSSPVSGSDAGSSSSVTTTVPPTSSVEESKALIVPEGGKLLTITPDKLGELPATVSASGTFVSSELTFGYLNAYHFTNTYDPNKGEESLFLKSKDSLSCVFNEASLGTIYGISMAYSNACSKGAIPLITLGTTKVALTTEVGVKQVTVSPSIPAGSCVVNGLEDYKAGFFNIQSTALKNLQIVKLEIAYKL